MLPSVVAFFPVGGSIFGTEVVLFLRGVSIFFQRGWPSLIHLTPSFSGDGSIPSRRSRFSRPFLMRQIPLPFNGDDPFPSKSDTFFNENNPLSGRLSFEEVALSSSRFLLFNTADPFIPMDVAFFVLKGLVLFPNGKEPPPSGGQRFFQSELDLFHQRWPLSLCQFFEWGVIIFSARQTPLFQ